MDDPRATEDAVEASMREDGFLSPWFPRLIPEYRSLDPGPFNHAEDLNRLGMAMAMENDEIIVGKSSLDPVCLGYRTFFRALSAFQGVVILAKRGMDAEADTLTRSVYETGFWLGFLAREGEVAQQAMIADEKANKRSLFRHFRGLPEATPEDVAALDLAVAGWNLERAAQLKDVAERGGLGRHYRFYRELSAVSAHVSLHSLHRFLKAQPDGSYNGHIFGPNPDAVYRSLWYACDAIRVNIETFRWLVGGTSRDDEFEHLLDRHHQDFATPERGR